MPTSDKQRKFNRGASTGFRLPVPVLPKVPDLRTPAAREQFDGDMEDWRKKLQFGQEGVSFGTGLGGGAVVVTPTPTTVPVPGPQGEKGEAGERGLTGPSGLLTVIRIHVWIAKRTDGIPGRGVLIDPYDGSTWQKLDTLLRSFGPNTVIHFGPGVFETRGYPSADIASAFRWELKTGWKLLGSGIDQTTLKLVEADIDESFVTIASSTQFIEDVEISDITFDCDLSGQPGLVKVGAISLAGNRSIIRRVRIINWGTTTATFSEPFALSVGVSLPFHGDISGCLIDGVIIDRPTAIGATTGVGSMIGVGGAETQRVWTGATFTRTGAVATATLTGGTRHGLSIGQWFRTRGAAQTEYNGSFKVTEVVSVSVVKYAVTGTPATPATGTTEVEHAYDPSGLGTGMLRNLVIRNCLLDADDFIGADVHAITIGGVDGAIVESNTIRNMTRPIYMDTFRGLSVTYRHNVIQRCVGGIEFALVPEPYGVDTVIIENNLIELLALPIVAVEDYIPMVNTPAQAVGIVLGGGRTSLPYSFRLVIIRDNVLRFADGADSAAYLSVAIGARSVELMMITGNMIGFREPNQIRMFDPVAKVIANNNRNIDGQIVTVQRVDTGLNYPDPDIELDKAQKLACIGF